MKKFKVKWYHLLIGIVLLLALIKSPIKPVAFTIGEQCTSAEDCIPDSNCKTAACDQGLCYYTNVPDGTSCGENKQCTIGMCYLECGEVICPAYAQCTTPYEIVSRTCIDKCGNGRIESNVCPGPPDGLCEWVQYLLGIPCAAVFIGIAFIGLLIYIILRKKDG